MDNRVFAIVLAAGEAHPDLQALGVKRVPMLRLRGDEVSPTIAEHVVQQLLLGGCRHVQVLAPVEVTAKFSTKAISGGVSVLSEKGWSRRDAGANTMHALRQAIEDAWLNHYKMVMIASADLPDLTATEVIQLRVCGYDTAADVVIPIATRYTLEATYGKEVQRTYVPLDTEITNGNVFYFSIHWIRNNFSVVEQLFSRRKSVSATAKIFGGYLVLRLLLAKMKICRLSLDKATRIVKRRLKVGLQILVLTHGGAAMDLDKPKDLPALGRLLLPGQLHST